MNDDTADQIAATRAAFDQFNAFSKDVAACMTAYRRELLAGGLSEADALQMLLVYQALVVGTILGGTQ